MKKGFYRLNQRKNLKGCGCKMKMTSIEEMAFRPLPLVTKKFL
jgi:hypothetical protein